MSFTIQQSGAVRRAPVEVSVADFRQRASAGLSFWRGLVVGLLAGLTLGWGIYAGILTRAWH